MMKLYKSNSFQLLLLTVINLSLFIQGDQRTASTNSNNINDSHCKVEHLQNQSPLFVGNDYEVLEILPHNPKAFTQGLTFYDDKLYEGTGLYGGESEIRHISTSNPAQTVRKSRALADHLFGEGITYFKNGDGRDCIIQLTWREKSGFLYDSNTFEVLKEFKFQTGTGEGWGITYDPKSKEFIVSDGSNKLFFWDRDTLEEKRQISVHLDPTRIDSKKKNQGLLWYINELEYVEHSTCNSLFQNDLSNEKNGIILANVWYQDILLAIQPHSGKVLKIYDLSELYVERDPSADCLNGISISNEEGVFYVTGKLWPYMYKIRLK